MLCDKKGTRALAPVRRPPRRGVRSAALPAHPPPNPPPVPVQPHAPSSSPGAFSVNQTRPAVPHPCDSRSAGPSVTSASSPSLRPYPSSPHPPSYALSAWPPHPGVLRFWGASLCPLRSAPPESGPAERTTTQIGSRPSLSSSPEPPPAHPATDLQVLTDLYAQIMR